MPWPSMKATMSSFTVVRSSGVGDILGKTRKPLLYAVRKFGASASPRSVRGRRGRHQGGKHAVELFGIEVALNFNWLREGPERIFGSPNQRVSITSAAVQIDGHVARLALCNESWVDPSGGGQFVPHDVGTRREHGETGDVARQRSSAGFDLLYERRRHVGLDRNVSGSAGDLLPRRAQHDFRCFRIEPEVELV